ncbi:hypothetical protein EDB89DRAFT_2028971 [Lactarius sanguifluus]|nr:hypothetical protein EDB89DRAFT_2028971 [Lactarius sanguifluus]
MLLHCDLCLRLISVSVSVSASAFLRYHDSLPSPLWRDLCVVISNPWTLLHATHDSEATQPDLRNVERFYGAYKCGTPHGKFPRRS